jgi:hypothetical protein
MWKKELTHVACLLRMNPLDMLDLEHIEWRKDEEETLQ